MPKVINRISITEDITFSKDDWKDLFQTLVKFKKRVLKRHKRMTGTEDEHKRS